MISFSIGFLCGVILARILDVFSPSFKEDECAQQIVFQKGYDEGYNEGRREAGTQ